MSDAPKKLSEIDRFWDLESLLPQKRPVSPTVRQPNTDTVEVELGGDGVSQPGTAIPKRPDGVGSSVSVRSPHEQARRLNELPLRQKANEYRSKPLDPYLIYSPQSKLIRRVEVSRWESRFNFYENFINDAKRLWSRTAAECAHVSFFSYIPQYSQLKYAQLKWYLWWRDNVRRGVYLRTDFCYILLYIYEIINCPELISPEEGVIKLCDIWLNFRNEHRRIDSYMCEWLCDYCLIHKLPCPKQKLEPILSDIILSATLKEFYMDADGVSGAGMLIHSSSYEWRKSRYVTNENIEIFSTHIKAAFNKAYTEIFARDGEGYFKEYRVERTSYEGALCVYSNKRTVAVEYVSFARSPKFQFTVTDIIKYSENRIRMALGIKSRLKVEGLDDKLRACIDGYFDEHLPAPKKTRSVKNAELSPEVHEYDKLYEPLSSSLSLENALEIEKKSWSTTDILTSAFEDATDVAPITDVQPEPPIPEAPMPEPAAINEAAAPEMSGSDEFEALVSSLDDISKTALTSIMGGDSQGIKKAAEAHGLLADALADKINETAFDIIGDSIIEPEGTGYRIISDYEGDIAKWLK